MRRELLAYGHLVTREDAYLSGPITREHWLHEPLKHLAPPSQQPDPSINDFARLLNVGFAEPEEEEDESGT